MKKFTALVAMSALAASLAVPVAATAAEYSDNQIMLTDRSMRTSRLIGAQVHNEQGQPIGTIMDVLVKSGAVETMVVLSVGDYVGGGAKMVAVPLSHINLERAKPMMTGATRQSLAAMPVFIFPPAMHIQG